MRTWKENIPHLSLIFRMYNENETSVLTYDLLGVLYADFNSGR